MKQTFRNIVVAILTAEAKLLLRRKNPTIIAIAGSVGKTSTKDAIFAAIKDSVPSRKSQKSFNSELGVPLTVLGLQTGWDSPGHWLWNIVDGAFTALITTSYPSVLVLETGVDTPGDMDALTAWLKPDVVVITCLPAIPVHVEQFATPQGVIDEEMKLVHSLRPSGVLVYNNDDTIIKREIETVRHTKVGYGRFLPTDVNIKKDQVFYKNDVPAGVTFELSYEGVSQLVKIPGIVGLQHSYGCAAAVAVASHLGISIEAACAGLSSHTTPPGRLRIIPGIKGSTLIDDSYNSSPVAVEHALETTAMIKNAKRRIAVLGDMLELGKYSAVEHIRLGKHVASNYDVLLTVGVRARGFAEGALSGGMKESAIFQYEDTARAGRELQAMLKPGDVALIKASQGIRAEIIVEEVMQEPDRASELLARQDVVWRKRR
jgi:UDP-N-acetylmuramoyl-tripeptide--D-alanyl-D-alanine ligase